MVFIVLHGSFPNAHDMSVEPGKVMCGLREGYEELETAFNNVWIMFYYFLPSVILICFNTAIVVRLRKVKKVHKTIENQRGSQSANDVSLQTNASVTESTNVGELTESYTIDNSDFTTAAAATSRAQVTSVPEPAEPRDSNGKKISIPSGVK